MTDEFDFDYDEEFDDFSDDTPKNPEPPEESDLTSEVLKLKGISDPSKIKFEDESGNITERNWNDLSKEELITILTQQDPQDSELDDDEIELINNIRTSGLSVNDYLLLLAPPPQEPVKTYKVDSLSDEDLYALDLLEKVGSDNITDEEITQAIETAKQNESLFKKTVEGLRNEYIRLLEEQEKLTALQQEEQYKLQYQQFANSIYAEILGLNQFAGQDLELSQLDVDDLSSFILDLDQNGVSAFGKAMNDPALFTRAAFWLLNEDKIVEELNALILDSYKRGYEAAKQELQNPKVMFTLPKPALNTDPFIDDEDW